MSHSLWQMIGIAMILERFIELLKGTIFVKPYLSMNTPAIKGSYAIIIVATTMLLGFNIYEAGIVALIAFILHDILNMTFAIKEYLFSTMVLKELEMKYNHIMLSSEIPQEEA